MPLTFYVPFRLICVRCKGLFNAQAPGYAAQKHAYYFAMDTPFRPVEWQDADHALCEKCAGPRDRGKCAGCALTMDEAHGYRIGVYDVYCTYRCYAAYNRGLTEGRRV